MRARISPFIPFTSRPKMLAFPSSARANPERIRMVVVFPVPFGARKPYTTPHLTFKLNPFSADVFPCFFPNFQD
jgi:hypothetical protein